MRNVFPVATLVLLLALPVAILAEIVGVLPAGFVDIPTFITVYVTIGMLGMLSVEEYQTPTRSRRRKSARSEQPATSSRPEAVLHTTWIHQTASS